MHHSDLGNLYTSEPFKRNMAGHGAIYGMSRAGNCLDNAAMGSCFSSLKTEHAVTKTYRTRDQAKADLFDYSDRCYHPRRWHSTLGYLSPMEFERQSELV